MTVCVCVGAVREQTDRVELFLMMLKCLNLTNNQTTVEINVGLMLDFHTSLI